MARNYRHIQEYEKEIFELRKRINITTNSRKAWSCQKTIGGFFRYICLSYPNMEAQSGIRCGFIV